MESNYDYEIAGDSSVSSYCLTRIVAPGNRIRVKVQQHTKGILTQVLKDSELTYIVKHEINCFLKKEN